MSCKLRLLTVLIIGANLSYGNTTGGPVFTLLGTGDAGDYTYSLTFTNSQGTTVTFGPALVRVGARATIRDSTLGRIICDRLNEDNRITAEYNITCQRGDDLYFRVILTPKMGKNPRVTNDQVTLSPGSRNIYLAAGVDPLSGDAIFNLSGAATGMSGTAEIFWE